MLRGTTGVLGVLGDSNGTMGARGTRGVLRGSKQVLQGYSGGPNRVLGY